MSSHLRDIKTRIDALQKTGMITEALQHISIAKTKKVQKNLMNYFQFLVPFNRVLFHLASQLSDHVIVKGNQTAKTLYIFITSDRGLVGSYHQQLFKRMKEEIQKNPNYQMIVIGKKGFYYAQKNKWQMVNQNVIINRDFVSTFYFKNHSRLMYQSFLDQKIGTVKLVYMHFVNRASQKVKIEQVLPLQVSKKLREEKADDRYIYEQKTDQLIENLALMHLDTKIYGALVDSQSSEHASRLNAMQTATDNVEHITKELKMTYHRMRQQDITDELIDIVNGSSL